MNDAEQIANARMNHDASSVGREIVTPERPLL
jgi:hypothetical protein